MRCATWAKQAGATAAFARAVFRREFAQGADIADPAVLSEAAAEAGLDPVEMRRAAGSEEIKLALRQATDAAWERGVRGVPSVVVGEAVFYGDDQVELAASV
jgi:2-hydroxychromene-2-carboxylate isomerase